MTGVECEIEPLVLLPLEGGGRCVRGLDGDHRTRQLLDRRLSRWTHRVGVTGSALQRHPHLDAPNELAPLRTMCGAAGSKQTALTRGASSSPLKGEAGERGARP